MLNKNLAENSCDIDLAVVWSVNANNSLTNTYAFSPYQMAIGANPKLSSIHNAKALKLTSTPTNKVICKN